MEKCVRLPNTNTRANDRHRAWGGEVQTGEYHDENNKREGEGEKQSRRENAPSSVYAFKDGSPFLFLSRKLLLVCIVFPFLPFLMLRFRACSRAYSRACSLCLFSVIEVTTVPLWRDTVPYEQKPWRLLSVRTPGSVFVFHPLAAWGWGGDR